MEFCPSESDIYFYNHHRYQGKLKGLSPIEYRTKAAKIIFYYFHCLLDRVQFKSFGFLYV
ncbi:IS3 family transposase [Gracilibacillus sp. HCP3S3_G5_1]|uniref:IS3 family transposase n=1 Tax=unclassified Gracilibacillus TaxID=2625209 RepID=UPI003F8BAB1D